MSRPIAVFQHTQVGAPGAIVPILESLGREVVIIKVVDGEPIPSAPDDFGGLVFLGGFMSAHDPLPWIRQEFDLIRLAAAREISMAGHCLGSQILALGLGGQVRRAPLAEIGWCEIEALDSKVARAWWGPHAGQSLSTFQWHSDTFDPPDGAVQIAAGRHCAHQAFVLSDRHLLLQSHLEMTPELVALSVHRNGHQLERQNLLDNPACSGLSDIEHDAAQRTARMHVLLLELYRQWLVRCP